MAARNKPPSYRIHARTAQPIVIELPVQVGSTQAIKIGEICKLRDPSDIASYPIIPVSGNDTGAIFLIACEEQAATDEARNIKFWLPTTDVSFYFALNAATAVKMGDKIQIHDSQTLKVSSAYTIGAAVATPLADASWQSVSIVEAVFGLARAEAVKHFPFAGCAVAGTVAGLDDMDDVGTLAYTAGKILVADGDSYEEVAVSGDVTLAYGGAITVAKILDGANVGVVADSTPGIPIIVEKAFTGAGAETHIFNANCPYKLRILDVSVLITTAGATGAAVTLTLDDGTNAITDAMAVNASPGGVAIDTIVRAATIDSTYATLLANATLDITLSTTTNAPAGIVRVTAIPVA